MEDYKCEVCGHWTVCANCSSCSHCSEAELQRLRRVEEAAIILMKELKECGWTSPLENEPRFSALKAALEDK